MSNTFSLPCPWCAGEIPWPYKDRDVRWSNTIPVCSTCLGRVLAVPRPYRLVLSPFQPALVMSIPEAGGWDLVPEYEDPSTVSWIMRNPPEGLSGMVGELVEILGQLENAGYRNDLQKRVGL